MQKEIPFDVITISKFNVHNHLDYVMRIIKKCAFHIPVVRNAMGDG